MQNVPAEIQGFSVLRLAKQAWHFTHAPLCLLCGLSQGHLRRRHACLRSQPTAMSKHQWWNGKENQAKGTRNHTTESLKESMDDRHNMFAPFLYNMVFTNVIRFLKKEGNIRSSLRIRSVPKMALLRRHFPDLRDGFRG